MPTIERLPAGLAGEGTREARESGEDKPVGTGDGGSGDFCGEGTDGEAGGAREDEEVANEPMGDRVLEGDEDREGEWEIGVVEGGGEVTVVLGIYIEGDNGLVVPIGPKTGEVVGGVGVRRDSAGTGVVIVTSDSPSAVETSMGSAGVDASSALTEVSSACSVSDSGDGLRAGAGSGPTLTTARLLRAIDVVKFFTAAGAGGGSESLEGIIL